MITTISTADCTQSNKILRFSKPFKHWLAEVDRQTGQKLQIFGSGNGGENTFCEMSSFTKDHGIPHQENAYYNTHQGGIAEIVNRTLGNLVRSMLQHRHLPKSF